MLVYHQRLPDMTSYRMSLDVSVSSKDILYEVMSGNHGDTLTSKDILYEVMSGNLWWYTNI
jgi:hypothetical protein